MIIYPAIDLRGGKVVRLREGDPAQQTIFSDDPIAVASGWIEQGAEWLHVVSLDGAFDAHHDNNRVIKEICQLPVKVQSGGGVRSLDAIRGFLDVGVSRVVVGTLAARNPDQVSLAIEALGAESLCIAMDARDGFVTTHGWTEQTALTPTTLGNLMRERGVRHALFTDVSRDGGMMGVNIDDTVALARSTGLQVIASGGISTLAEIQELTDSGSVAGAVIGMALYRKEITLQEAILAAKEQG